MNIHQAIEHFGSQVKLAAALDVSRQAVQQWAKKGTLPELRQYKLREALERQSLQPGQSIDRSPADQSEASSPR